MGLALSISRPVTQTESVPTPYLRRINSLSDKHSCVEQGTYDPDRKALGEWSLEKFPRLTIKQPIAGESTYSPTQLNKVTDSVLRDPAAVECLTKLTPSSSPWEDRKPGFENDIEVIRSVENKPLPLESVQCPTLIVHGTADDDVPYFVAMRAHARIENSEFYTMDDAGHLLWIDPATAEMNRHQTNFVSAHA